MLRGRRSRSENNSLFKLSTGTLLKLKQIHIPMEWTKAKSRQNKCLYKQTTEEHNSHQGGRGMAGQESRQETETRLAPQRTKELTWLNTGGGREQIDYT